MPMAENVIAAAQAVGATHMLPGNVYNFGYDIAVGTRRTRRSAVDGEGRDPHRHGGAVPRAGTNAGVQTIVLRAGDFYGGTKPQSWLDLIILSKLRKNIFMWGGPTDIPHAFAYLPDLAKAFVALADKRSELGAFERFHFAGHTMTGLQMKAAAEAASGRELTLKGVPWVLLRAAGLFSPMMREIVKMSYLWRTPHSLDGASSSGRSARCRQPNRLTRSARRSPIWRWMTK